MNQNKFFALALCASLTLSLAACGSKDPDPTPDPSESTNAVVTTPEAQPTESTNVIVTTPEAQPTESVNVVAPDPQPTESTNVISPEESKAPVQVKPLETQTPSKDPDPTPAPTEEPEAPAETLTAADAYAKVSAVAGGNAMIDAGFVLTEFYNLSEDDLEDFVFYMAEMSATNEEIFIAKVKSGKMSDIQSACESRKQGLTEEAAIYPAAAAYVESSRIVVNGDWIMFAVVASPSEAESAFNDYTK